MAAPAGAQSRYSLTIISASLVRNTLPSPAFYLTLASSESKVCKTTTIRSAAPTWNHTVHLIAESSPVLTFRLKCSRGRLIPSSVVGSVNIASADLLDRCSEEQQTTLTLLDHRHRPVGSLIVRLREEPHSMLGRAAEATGLDTNSDVTGQGPIAPHPSPALAQTPVQSAAPRRPVGNDIAESLHQVVDKLQIMVDGVDETAKLRPYVIIARHAMGSAHEYALGRIDRAKALHDLVMSMASLYSFVDVGGDSKGTIAGFEDVIIRIAVQTVECGIFILQYISNTGDILPAQQTISETQEIVSHLSDALQLLKGELTTKGTPPTTFVSAQTGRYTNRQDETSLIALLEPANMDVEYRETCLPGTRVDILQDLLACLINPTSSYKITWLRGPAGCGKSTILNTVAQYSSKLRRCSAFLFWDRNDVTNSDPRRVIRTLAYQLAQSNPAFAELLASRIKASPQILKSSLDEQFQGLVQEPLATLAARHDSGPMIIVLDALDECGTPEARKKLLDALSTSLAKLPGMFQLLIASRDEPDIRVALSRPGVVICDVLINNKTTTSDISLFFRQRLSSHAPAFSARGLPYDWPGDPVRQRLVTLSGGLFIWAATTIRFIESGLPEKRLERVLDSSARGQSYDRLGELYQVALTHPFDSYDEDELAAVHSILGAIVLTREQLTDEQLGRLLDLELSTVQEVLSRLQPLLQGGHGEPVQVLHTSFADFLCHPERRQDVRWHIDVSVHHSKLAFDCLRLMRRDLKFNICNIETSYRRHLETEGIQERVDKTITPVLMYASVYWVDHLELGIAVPGSDQLVDEVTNFIKDRLLYWIEVFSLKNQMSTMCVILQKAASWAKRCNPELEGVVLEAHKFVNAFAYPIGHSLPHIYLSALPFSPSESAVLQRMRDIFQNTLSVEGGSPKWPVIGQTLAGHSNIIASVAFSPDSTRVVSGSKDSTVRIWDAVSGVPIDDPLQGHSSQVCSVSFSPDGARIISGSFDKTIRIWDVMSGTLVGEPLVGHWGHVLSVAPSPDGTRIISGSADGTIRIWNAVTGTSIGKPLQKHSGSVWSVAISPDGAHIVSGSSDSTVQIWDAVSGTPIGEPLRRHVGSVRSVAYSPDGTRIASGSADRSIQCWDAMSHAPIGELLQGHYGGVNSVAFSSGGTRIVSGSGDGTVRIWDAALGEPIGTPLRGHSGIVTSVAVSPDGTRFASGSADNTVRMWDAVCNAPTHELLHQHFDSVLSGAFSPDGTLISSGSDDTTVRIWDAASGAPIGSPLRGHSGAVVSVTFSPDGFRIASGSSDGTVRVWDTVSGAQINGPLAGHLGRICSVVFSPDGARIVSGSSDTTVQIWDAVSGAPIGAPLKGHNGPVRSVAFSPNGSHIASASEDCTIRVWDAVSHVQICEPLGGHSGWIRSIAYSPDSTRIVSGSGDNTVRIWNAVLGTPIGEPLQGHSDSVGSVAYTPDGTRIISGSRDRTVRIWDAVSGAPIGGPLQGHSHAVISVGISPEGTRIASASHDNTIRIWDASPAADTSTSQQHDSAVVSVNAHHLRDVVVTDRAPAFSNGSVLHGDGWMTTVDGLLLFWVPPEYQSRLPGPRTLAIIGPQPVQIKLDHFVHGPQWTLCQTGSQ